MSIITGSDLEYLKERFDTELKSDVRFNFFTRSSFITTAEAETAAEANHNAEDDETGEMFTAEAARVTAQILEELVTIAPDYLSVVTHDLDSEAGQKAAEEAGLNGEMLPAIVYESENLKGKSRYFGLPSGYEFGSLVENLVDLSSGETVLKPKTLENLATVQTSVQIMVFVTPT